MTNSALPNSSNPAASDRTTNQQSEGNQNQIIGQAVSSTIFNVTGGQITIYPSQLDRPCPAGTQPSTSKIGANPYQGLLAFQETDGDRFFGREKEITILWEKLSILHEETSVTSVLPIFGPSGSGKSSLARAGLIPELARRPLPGRDRARVAVLVPGTYPLEALATVLARVATNDPTPVTKTREFAAELAQANSSGQYDGLRRIINVLPETEVSPLILLVDQFEEIYTLCKDVVARDRFVENLLEAAAEQSQQVLIVITLRSDFLGEIQKHPQLNRLFSRQGFLVPAMTEEELRQVIAKPAELAGHPLDEATIYLLVEDTEGREGALPLLQCALSCIWKGLANGITPAQTLEQIGGVGGAMAGEAQEVYDSLNAPEQGIARRLFLGLVQLGEGTRDTRRRVAVDCLISHKDNPEQVKQVMNRFAEPGVRLITCSTSHEGIETAEITHEALFDHWRSLNQWLEQSRSDLRFQRRVEEDAQYWEQNDRPEGCLWRPPELNLLKQYQDRVEANITHLQMEFFTASQKAEEIRRQEKTQHQRRERQQRLQKWALCILIPSVIGFAFYQQQQAEVREVKQLADFAESLLSNQPLNAENNVMAQINAIAAVDLSQSALIHLTHDAIANSASSTLLHSIQVDQGRRLLSDQIISVAFSPDGTRMVSGSEDNTVRVWNTNTRQPIGQRFKGHQKAVLAVAFSPDGTKIISGSVDKTIRLWNASTGEPIGNPLKGHRYSVVSVAFSPDGTKIVSGSDDKTIRLWDTRTGKQVRPLKRKGNEDNFQPVLVSFSADGETILGKSYDNTLRSWNATTGEPENELKEEDSQTAPVIFSGGGKTIVSDSYNDKINLRESLLKIACLQLSEYSSLTKSETAVGKKVKQICDRHS
jgi:WD domain, G-beta repeat